MIEILHEVYRFAEEIQDATQQVATLGESMAIIRRPGYQQTRRKQGYRIAAADHL
jgi:hypothetical protein